MTTFFILNALLNVFYTIYAFYKQRDRVKNYIKQINDDIELFSTAAVTLLYLIVMIAPITSTLFTVYIVLAAIIEGIRKSD